MLKTNFGCKYKLFEANIAFCWILCKRIVTIYGDVVVILIGRPSDCDVA